MNEFIKTLPQQVVEAYRRTGFKAAPLELLAEYLPGKFQACAIGVLAYVEGINDPHDSIKTWEWIGKKLDDVPENDYYAKSCEFSCGFDAGLYGSTGEDSAACYSDPQFHLLGIWTAWVVREAGLR